MPPPIAQRSVPLTAGLAALVEAATGRIHELDRSGGDSLEALGVLLLRAESVASSKIERVEASLDDYARALHGVKSNPSAVSMVAATEALAIMIDRVAATRIIDGATLCDAHAILMRDDPAEQAFAGRLRTVQNWVGGSNHSPRNALLVPPPPDLVPGLIDDLVAFCQRDDLPALLQAAIAHAQFETIHPFTDGNGRIGRALVNSVLRRRGVTTRVVVPLASALVVHRDRYFDLLTGYRAGRIEPLAASFARAAELVAAEAQLTAARLSAVPGEWEQALGSARRDSAAVRLLPHLLVQPIVTSDDVLALLDTAPSRAHAAIDRLHRAGVLRPLTQRKRHQVWGASAVLDELDDLGARIAAAAR